MSVQEDEIEEFEGLIGFASAIGCVRDSIEMDYVCSLLLSWFVYMQKSIFFAANILGPETHQVSCLYLPSFSIAARYPSASSLSILPSFTNTSTNASRTASGILPLLPHK